MNFLLRRWIVIRYLSAYILSILSFALVYYYWLPDQFYHSTIKFEPDTQLAEAQLRQLVQETFRSPGFLDPCGDDWQIDRSELTLTHIAVEGDDVHVSTQLLATRQGLTYFLQPSLRFSLTAQATVAQKTSGGRGAPRDLRLITFENFVLLPQNATTQSQIAFERCLLPYRYEGLAGDVVLVSFPRNVFRQLQSYAVAVGGSPSGLPGHFWRMLYLSTSTITTTGFGDIVPLTRNARIAVSVEAVVGLVIMGLFINEISKRK